MTSNLDDILDNALEEFDKEDIPIQQTIHTTSATSNPSNPINNSVGVSSSSSSSVTPNSSDEFPSFTQFLSQLNIDPNNPNAEVSDEQLQKLAKAMGELSVLAGDPSANNNNDNSVDTSNAMAELNSLLTTLQSNDQLITQTTSTSSTQVSTSSPSTASSSSSSAVSSSLSNSGKDEVPNDPIASAVKMISEGARQLPNTPISSTNGTDKEMDEFLDKLLNDFGSSDKNNMDDMIETMMKQMLNKDYLYQPIKEICSKYPDWLKTNESKLKLDEFDNYTKQFQCFQKILNVFDQTPNDSKLIMTVMTELQSYGSPPKEIVGDYLPPGLDFGNDGVPNVPGFPGLGGNDAAGMGFNEEQLKQLAKNGCSIM